MQFILKTTLECNLHCMYCYEKGRRNKFHGNVKGTFNKLVERIEEAGITENSNIILHGGEPLLLSPELLEHMLVFRNDQTGETYIRNFYVRKRFCRSIQTNLTLLNEELIALFKKYGVILGVSFDGSGDLGINRDKQDVTRKNLERLAQEGVRCNIVTVLTKANAGSYEKLDRLFDEVTALASNVKFGYGIGYDQLDPEDYAEKALYLFKKSMPLIIEEDREIRPYIHYLDSMSGFFPRPTECSMRGCQLDIGFFGVLPNGDVMTCCRYLDSPVLGNIFSHSIAEIVESVKRHNLAERYEKLFSGPCKGCAMFNVCYGGCLAEEDPETGVTYHCAAHKKIGDYILSGAMEAEFPLYDFIAWAKDKARIYGLLA